MVISDLAACVNRVRSLIVCSQFFDPCSPTKTQGLLLHDGVDSPYLFVGERERAVVTFLAAAFFRVFLPTVELRDARNDEFSTAVDPPRNKNKRPTLPQPNPNSLHPLPQPKIGRKQFPWDVGRGLHGQGTGSLARVVIRASYLSGKGILEIGRNDFGSHNFGKKWPFQRYGNRDNC